jgi:hypothetical protein
VLHLAFAALLAVTSTVQPSPPAPAPTPPAPLASSLRCTIDESGVSRKAPGFPVGQIVPFVTCLDENGDPIVRWWNPGAGCKVGATLVMRDWAYSCRSARSRT